MQSRMDKYNTSKLQINSRTQKNQSLYDEVRNSAMTEFDVNSNISIIDDNADHINVAKIRKMLDKKYNDDLPKRRSIQLPQEDEQIIDEPLGDTKEYDINAILQKAKQGKNIDYNRERLKKVREAQFDILNNLDLELKKVDETKNNKNKEAEDNLFNLINTITELELKNKTSNYKEASEALDLLSDLKDEQVTDDEDENEDSDKKMENSLEKKNNDRDSHIEKTLSKLNIDISSYDDFSDISKRDNGMLFIKIVIFLIVISLVIGAVYILDNVLSLGLF